MNKFTATHTITARNGYKHIVMLTEAGYQNYQEWADGVAPALADRQGRLYCDGVECEEGYGISRVRARKTAA